MFLYPCVGLASSPLCVFLVVSGRATGLWIGVCESISLKDRSMVMDGEKSRKARGRKLGGAELKLEYRAGKP